MRLLGPSRVLTPNRAMTTYGRAPFLLLPYLPSPGNTKLAPINPDVAIDFVNKQRTNGQSVTFGPQQGGKEGRVEVERGVSKDVRLVIEEGASCFIWKRVTVSWKTRFYTPLHSLTNIFHQSDSSLHKSAHPSLRQLNLIKTELWGLRKRLNNPAFTPRFEPSPRNQYLKALWDHSVCKAGRPFRPGMFRGRTMRALKKSSNGCVRSMVSSSIAEPKQNERARGLISR